MTPDPTQGHVRLPRAAYRDHPWWTESRAFSKWEAWEDCLQMAAFKAGARTFPNGAVERLERGEFLASLRFLAERWGWSVKQVRGFVTIAERMGHFSAQREAQHGTVYLVADYDTWAGAGTREGTAEGTHQGIGRAQEGHKVEEREERKELQQQQHDASHGDASSGAGSAVAIAVRVERTTVVRPGRPSRARPPFAYPPDFEACWAAYPPRASGDNPKRKAYDQWAARRAEGVPAETLLAGTARYAAYCAAAYGGPEDRVMHGATFYGRDRRFESAWNPPPATTAAGGGSGTAAGAASEAEALYARLESHGLLTFGGNREAYDAAIRAATPDGTEPAAFRALVRGVTAWTLAAEGERRFAVRALERRLAAYRGAATPPAGGTGTGGLLRPPLAAAMGGVR